MTTSPALRRTLTLPWLVFYGVGVTIGAGIFALIGEVLSVAGDLTVWSFLLAGGVAGLTGVSYMLLSSAFPRAAGPAIFVKAALGSAMGRILGYAVVAVAITSSATISLAFARYLSAYLPFPEWLTVFALIGALCLVALAGIRESVAFAAIVTVIEVATLLWVVAAGLPHLDQDAVIRILNPPSLTDILPMATGAFIAFFAFIGFEDIVNMAEETHDASRSVPLAISITLIVSLIIYATVALVAAVFPDRQAIAGGAAPLAALYSGYTGKSSAPIVALAGIAMINGILVQMLMASRVLFGMANEGLAPAWLGAVQEQRQVPARATVLVAAVILVLTLFIPLVRLAEFTSLVMLLIFALVNVSLVVIGGRREHTRLHRWRWWGLIGSAVALALVAAEIAG